jgi:hypothetical protein
MMPSFKISQLPEIPTIAKRFSEKADPNMTLVRLSPDELASVGRLTAQKLNRAKGPTRVFIPLKGFLTRTEKICPTCGQVIDETPILTSYTDWTPKWYSNWSEEEL